MPLNSTPSPPLLLQPKPGGAGAPAVAAAVGFPVGLGGDVEEGGAVPRVDGAAVAAAVGSAVGIAVGSAVVGSDVGSDVGSAVVEIAVGSDVGSAVGDGDGLGDRRAEAGNGGGRRRSKSGVSYPSPPFTKYPHAVSKSYQQS